MADIIKINIEFTPQRERLLIIPDKIEVKLGSIVQWNLVGLKRYYRDSGFFRRGMVITLYFNDQSPFRWKRQFVQIYGEPPFFPPYPSNLVRLAEDAADEKGEYKYGVKVDDAGSNETIYDDDPFLIVY
ncbi:MAG: hypothetical protein U0U09_02400 [Cyclobacteriaceae bacterium]